MVGLAYGIYHHFIERLESQIIKIVGSNKTKGPKQDIQNRLRLPMPEGGEPFTTKVVSSNLSHGEEYSIQHYVIKFVSDLLRVGGFLRVRRFPPSKNLTTTI
jgi:hypothetical protein